MASEAVNILEFLASLEGAENARIVSIAFFCLTVYEWIITLDEEIEYFWSGPWTSSRVLFLMNRYIPPIIMLLGLICFFTPNPTEEFCYPAIRTSFMSNTISIAIIQAILVLRVWHLFNRTPIVRWGIVGGYVATVVASLTFSGIAARDLDVLQSLNHSEVVTVVGCRAARPQHLWRIYFPSLILHTALYLLTAIHAIQNRRVLQQAPIFKRLLRDGGFFYLIVFVSVAFSSIGAFFTQNAQVNIPIAFSSFLVATNSIAVSRVMLSIHSLAAKLGSDSSWVLSHIELSRLDWRKGARDGEIIVERWTAEFDDEPSYDDHKRSLDTRSMTPIKMTRIGVYTEGAW